MRNPFPQIGLLFVGFVALASCGELGNPAVAEAVCPELRGGAMSANFEADAHANATIRAFVAASGDLVAVAAAAENEVAAACERMGRDLGVPPEQMAPQENQSRATSACNAVSARMDAILGTGAQVRVDYTPPQCQADANVEASCRGQCSAQLDPGYVKANCAPGHLYGRCSGNCSGSCAGACSGSCAGNTTASGQCEGTCNGSCNGDCHGSCSIDFQEPKCDVAMQGPSADARCDGSCKAHANFTAQCTPAQVRVSASANTQEMAALTATLTANLPPLLTAQLAYGANALGQITEHAAACVGAAANACVQAQASLRVSVSVSASVSAKAGAHT